MANIVTDNILLTEKLGAIPVECPTEEYLNLCCTRIKDIPVEYQEFDEDDYINADLYKDDKTYKLFCVLYDREWERVQQPTRPEWEYWSKGL